MDGFCTEPLADRACGWQAFSPLLGPWPRKPQNQLPAATAPLSASRRRFGPPPTNSAATSTPPNTNTSVLGRLFLTYISDAFAESHAALLPKRRPGGLHAPPP